ncbi:MAG: EutN/CcmL family microcompartment protein, partial [Planctomycetales bacterium]|nr:EutN/CcmL family microcompartment protein [Planctomycetales bacterium]
MRIAKVIGTVTLNRAHPTFECARLRIAVPMMLDDLQADTEPTTEDLVVYDELGAGIDSLIMVSEGGEA